MEHHLDRRSPTGVSAYVLATVVAVDRPVSAKPGDSATISSTGVVHGWVGGSCSEPIVVREAMSALTDGRARLVRIRPPGATPEPDRPGVVNAITTCASEGGLDVFVEPKLPQPHLVLVGSSPVTRALTKLADVVGYRTTAVLEDTNEGDPGAGALVRMGQMAALDLGPRDAVIVATMNHYDELALEEALGTRAGYVGLVASGARARSVTDMLAARGMSPDDVARIHSPAGLDLGPSSQHEIALAILAEVVEHRHEAEAASGPAGAGRTSTVSEAIDPVCGMTVAMVSGAITAQHDGVTYYFCAPGCRHAFMEDPDKYVAAGA